MQWWEMKIFLDFFRNLNFWVNIMDERFLIFLTFENCMADLEGPLHKFTQIAVINLTYKFLAYLL